MGHRRVAPRRLSAINDCISSVAAGRVFGANCTSSSPELDLLKDRASLLDRSMILFNGSAGSKLSVLLSYAAYPSLPVALLTSDKSDCAVVTGETRSIAAMVGNGNPALLLGLK